MIDCPKCCETAAIRIGASQTTQHFYCTACGNEFVKPIYFLMDLIKDENRKEVQS